MGEYDYTRLAEQLKVVIRLAVQHEIKGSELQRQLYPLGSPRIADLLTSTAPLSQLAARQSVGQAAEGPLRIDPATSREWLKLLAKTTVLPSVPENIPKPDTDQKSELSPLRNWIIEVWSYSGVLAVILTAIGWLFSGSLRLLGPVVFVCIAGGVIGTVLALLRFVQEQQDSGSASNYYERRIIR